MAKKPKWLVETSTADLLMMAKDLMKGKTSEQSDINKVKKIIDELIERMPADSEDITVKGLLDEAISKLQEASTTYDEELEAMADVDEDDEEEDDEEDDEEEEEDVDDEEDDDEEEEDDDDDEVDLEEMSDKELKALAKEYGVKVTKNKKGKLNRKKLILAVYDALEDDEDEDEWEEPTMDWTIQELRKTASKGCGLTLNGKEKKGQLIKMINQARA